MLMHACRLSQHTWKGLLWSACDVFLKPDYGGEVMLEIHITGGPEQAFQGMLVNCPV